MRYRCSILDWAVLAVAGVSALVCMSRLFGFLVDDAFISFRYAENLAAGRGLVFNPGERVEGYSNLLWVLILAGANRLGLPTIATAQGLGCVAAFLALMLTFFLRRRSPAHFAALLLAASLPWALWAVSGMETLLLPARDPGGVRTVARARAGPGSGHRLPPRVWRP
ncbi:hypothetical protein HS125_16035 [bacterium]|nr:hypothetical protein [bacterium]